MTRPAASDAWYRSPGWDDASRTEFETRLARARAASRPQYRRIKALALLGSGDVASAAAGADLLETNVALADVPLHERVLALVVLADHDRRHGRLMDAERRLRAAVDLAGPDGIGTTGEEEIALAEILLERGSDPDARDAKALLDRRATEMPLFVRSRYRLAVAQVRACLALGRSSEAADWASAALELAEARDSGLVNHPQVGLVEASGDELRWLRQMVDRRR